MPQLSFIGNELVSFKKELERLINYFENKGAIYVEIPTLLNSDYYLISMVKN